MHFLQCAIIFAIAGQALGGTPKYKPSYSPIRHDIGRRQRDNTGCDNFHCRPPHPHPLEIRESDKSGPAKKQICLIRDDRGVCSSWKDAKDKRDSADCKTTGCGGPEQSLAGRDLLDADAKKPLVMPICKIRDGRGVCHHWVDGKPKSGRDSTQFSPILPRSEDMVFTHKPGRPLCVERDYKGNCTKYAKREETEKRNDDIADNKSYDRMNTCLQRSHEAYHDECISWGECSCDANHYNPAHHICQNYWCAGPGQPLDQPTANPDYKRAENTQRDTTRTTRSNVPEQQTGMIPCTCEGIYQAYDPAARPCYRVHWAEHCQGLGHPLEDYEAGLVDELETHHLQKRKRVCKKYGVRGLCMKWGDN